MEFECVWNRNNKTEKWPGKIVNFIPYESHYEIQINSRSFILVLFGISSDGYFVCMPDFNAGCHLTNTEDLFWNTERLTGIMGNVDGITVATALYYLQKNIPEL